jgi:hypothetical protein
LAGRSVSDPAQALGGIRKQLDDQRSTTNARITKRPTGTVEPTFAATAKSGTLMLDGQTVLRADYPVLWQWAQDNGAVTAGKFGIGNNSTTFTVPDMRNQVSTAGGIATINFLIWT